MNYFRLLIFIIVASSSSSCISFQPIRYSGTVKINDSIYLDQTEVTVHAWLSFYTWKLLNEGPVSANKVLPDSNAVNRLVWDYIKNKSSEFSNSISSSTFQPLGNFQTNCDESIKGNKLLTFVGSSVCPILSFPITGVSYEQVIEFCAWRTKIMGQGKVEYSLPTEKEWIELIALRFNESERSQDHMDSLLLKGKLCQKYNYRVSTPCEHRVENGLTEATFDPVRGYYSDNMDAYDSFGNVSEMTLTRGISKGGNYTLFASQCHPDSIQYYVKPEYWLGFRCIAAKVNQHSQSANGDNGMQTKKVEAMNRDSAAKNIDGFGKFTDNRDGKTYRIVLIGEQTWMAENLAYKPVSGTYWKYDGQKENLMRFGYLYNWKTAQNVCPIGWHLPSKVEFDTLLQRFGGGDKQIAYSELIPAGKSGFAILFGGLHIGWGAFYNDKWVSFWSSSNNSDYSRYACGLNIDGRISSAESIDRMLKSIGMPVRCIQNK